MDVRQITETYHAAPQVNPEDMAALAEAGFTTVICNRPDVEIPPSHHAAVMQQAAEAAGLDFHILPLTHQTFTPENIARHNSFVESASGRCLAYCASGTRSTYAWAMGQAGEMSVDDIVSAGAKGGYDLEPLRGMLEGLAASRS